MWTSRNVTFNMDCFPRDVTSVDTDMTQDRFRETTIHYDTGLHDVKSSSRDVEPVEVADKTIPNTGHLDDEDDNTQPQRSEPGRKRRIVRLPRRHDDFVMGDELENLALQSEALVASTVPGSAAEALADPNWKAAMQREYDSLMTSEVWSLVSRPTERQPITGKWHFAVKVNEDGKVTKYKARFAARGFTQTPGLDYHETYSPTVRLSTLRTVLACGVRQGIKFQQMDIKTAYLNAPKGEEIFVEQPEGFKQGDGDMVCKLKRSLHGLNKSGRNWYESLSHRLEQLGFHSSQHDKFLWTKRGATIIAGHWCGLTTSSTVQPTRTLDDGLRQRWANGSQLVTLALLRGS